MGIPIFHGAISTQFAVTVLAFSDSYILQTFYKMMTLVVCIGICYGAIILPAILTIFGPMEVVKYVKVQDENKENPVITTSTKPIVIHSTETGIQKSEI